MRPSIALASLAVIAALAVGACGESEEDKAQKAVCSARADIGKQVDQLQSLTVSTATADEVQQSVEAIKSDLSKIEDAQGELSDERRQQVEAANKTFTSQLRGIVESIGSSTSLSEAKSQLSSATQQLADAYKQSFAKIDCS
jgi:Tfp pilus assembly protein PilP